ncbi:MAG: VOC family protein [Sediminibacterium sp.]|nr:MAG: Glyoxalase/bleomycin resistance [Chitinophagaceae bacterium]MDP1843246.1 VOC family protein [Sediminibacterium sp.]
MKPYFLLIALFLTIINTATAQTKIKPIINHVAITVSNLPATVRFYTDILGIDTIANPFNDGKHVWLGIGTNAALHIIDQTLLPAGAPSKMTYSKGNHLCFSVASVDAIMTLLKKNAISWEDYPGKKGSFNLRPDGVKQIWFQDPEGNWIEINDAKQ